MPIDRIQPYLITNMSSNARRALTLLHTRSHKLGIEVAYSSLDKAFKMDNATYSSLDNVNFCVYYITTNN